MPVTRRSRAVKIAADLVDALDEVRRDSGMTVAQLAAAVAISERQLFRYLSGATAVPLWVAVGLADALAVDFGEIARRVS